MANEVSRYEKPSVLSTSNSTETCVIGKLNGVAHNLETSKKGDVLQKAKSVPSSLETNKNIKSKETPSLSSSNETATNEIKVNSQKNVQKIFQNAATSESKCIEDLSQEMQAEKAPEKDCRADSLLDSKNNSALNEGMVYLFQASFFHFFFVSFIFQGRKKNVIFLCNVNQGKVFLVLFKGGNNNCKILWETADIVQYFFLKSY